MQAGDYIGSVEIIGGEKKSVPVYALEDFSYPVSNGERPEFVLQGAGFVYAPVAQGQEGICAYICIGNKAVGKVMTCYGETVEKETEDKPSLWEKLFGGKQP